MNRVSSAEFGWISDIEGMGENIQYTMTLLPIPNSNARL